MLRALLCALLLVGCAARRPARPASPQDAALPAVDDCATWADPTLSRTLDRRTRSLARTGNAVDLLVNGKEAWERRLANSADADLILVKTFIFTDDATGRQVADLLRERARAGATVIVQYDIKGSLADGEAFSLLNDTGDTLLADKPLLASLAEDGVIVVPTNLPRTTRGAKKLLRARERAAAAAAKGEVPKWGLGAALTRFDHEKYWITGRVQADGKVELRAILGGMNIASEYAYGGTDKVDPDSKRGGWRDTDIEVVGPVTTDIVRRYFDALAANVTEWPASVQRMKWQTSQAPAGDATVRFVWNQPSWGTRDYIEHLYRVLMEQTPDDGIIRLESAYFTPSPRIRRPLVKQLKDGGRVAVITNSLASTDMGAVVAGSRGAFDVLLDASQSAALYEWQPKPGLQTMHSKLASFGTCGPVIVGSANLDGLSSNHNSESVVMVSDPAVRAELDAMYDADLAASARITEEELARAGRLVRWSQRGVYWLAWRLMNGE